MNENVSPKNSSLAGKAAMIKIRAMYGKENEDDKEILFARIEELFSDRKMLIDALSGITSLYEEDEGCRTLPEYVAARAALDSADSTI